MTSLPLFEGLISRVPTESAVPAAGTLGIDVCVFGSEGVAVQAQSLSRISRGHSSRTTARVDKPCHRLKMLRPSAGAVGAASGFHMIQLEAGRDRADKQLIGKAMGQNHPVADCKLPIAFLGASCEPDHAAIGAARVDFRPEAFLGGARVLGMLVGHLNLILSGVIGQAVSAALPSHFSLSGR